MSGTYFLPYDIIDMHGRIVHSGEVATYNGVLKSSFTLNNSPAGVYYLRVFGPEFNTLVKVVKVD